MNGQEKKWLNKINSDVHYVLNQHEEHAKERYEDNKSDHREIFERLNKLPCGERRWLTKAVYGIYGCIGLIVITLITYWVANGK